jgi:hypothetical protein
MDANNASYVSVNQIVSGWEGGRKVLREFTRYSCYVTHSEPKCHIVRCRLDMVRSRPNAKS